MTRDGSDSVRERSNLMATSMRCCAMHIAHGAYFFDAFDMDAIVECVRVKNKLQIW